MTTIVKVKPNDINLIFTGIQFHPEENTEDTFNSIKISLDIDTHTKSELRVNSPIRRTGRRSLKCFLNIDQLYSVSFIIQEHCLHLDLIAFCDGTTKFTEYEKSDILY